MTRRGFIHFDSWAGRTKHPVEVLSEAPVTYRGRRCLKVRLLEPAFRHPAGKVLRPPIWAVTFAEGG
jgi:hypothetical protein